MKMLDKITESGSFQIAMLLTASLIAMMILQQCGHGVVPSEFFSFVLMVDATVLGIRSQK